MILAYGQMGSGKTYSMTGDGTPEGRGLVPRLASALMSKLSWELKNGFCSIEVSYLEIYQEKVRDLLASTVKPPTLVDSMCLRAAPLRYYERADDLSTSDSEISETDTTESGGCGGGGMETYRRMAMQRPPGAPYQFSSFSFNAPSPYGARTVFLRVREHPVTGPYVEGLLWKEVTTWSDMEKCLRIGSLNRITGDTQLYKNSSRSHTLFTIKIIRRNPESVEGMPGHSVCYINLVDLAGSEKLQCIPIERREESRRINRSLSLLNEVILNLSRRSFVSYRNSALTWLLRDSLGGNSKTFLVANISPAEQDFQESVSTLRYASKANRIQSVLTVGNDPRKRIIYKMNEEIRTLNSLVSSLTEKNEVTA
ncbi:kinesin-like protein KIF16B isoform X1 [Selaginella moellendorffii]|uniref:kinesin-like protein KIF16B isoform X1 n=1 Tax=Selaginella moellendorffii TaxID=88036 RepID=UPI000D1CF8C9|nr:kinesin-like protein KIF16B isoform X1 [Selaginella moellendorffii]|eukprot:XP_024515815.1 kinesin-like protein KIF16B isoform X1 [Selaginella moellendorffii]